MDVLYCLVGSDAASVSPSRPFWSYFTSGSMPRRRSIHSETHSHVAIEHRNDEDADETRREIAGEDRRAHVAPADLGGAMGEDQRQPGQARRLWRS